MKHPALTRVFAIVLAVMCLVMLIAGAGGVRNAFNDKKRDDEALGLLISRTDSAEQLQKLLTESTSYDRQSGELDEVREQHESDASQHKTDLATYSATKGGTKMGADKLWEAKAQVESGRAQLESGMKQLEAGEAAYAAYQAALGLAGQCSAYTAELNSANGILAAAAQTAADPTTDPATIPALLYTAQTSAEAAMPNSGSYEPTKTACVALLTQISAISGVPFDSSMIPADISVTVNAADLQTTMTQIGTASYVLSSLGSGLTLFTSQSGMDATTGATLAATRTQLEGALAKLDSGEKEIQNNLELIWYQNGELAKDAAELEEKKQELEAESQTISELEAKAEEQKENERKYNSLKVLLKNNENISASVAAGNDLIDSARNEADRFAAQLQSDFIMRIVICGISILGALAGFAGIPAAFEKTKSRVSLILPVAACLLCSACAVGLSFYIGRGALYSALFTVPFALVQLLTVIPKNN